jgi:hypothetical protein
MKVLRKRHEKRQAMAIRKRLKERLAEKERRVQMRIKNEKRTIKHQLVTMEKRDADAAEAARLKATRFERGVAKAKRYAKAEAQAKREKHMKAFLDDKAWMRECRLERVAIEKKAMHRYEQRANRWWEEWDYENECTYWTREGGAYTYECPWMPKEEEGRCWDWGWEYWIDIFESYHELWYRFSVVDGSTTLWEEIEKKKAGFDQFAAAKAPGPPLGAYLDEMGDDLDNPAVGLTWHKPQEPGDQPMETYTVEGATLPADAGIRSGTLPAGTEDTLEWTTVTEGLDLSEDYLEINHYNFTGFAEFLAARQLAQMPGAMAPKPAAVFVFRVRAVSSVGPGDTALTELLDVLQGVEEEDQDEEEEIMPVLPPVKQFKSRRRKTNKKHIAMYDFKF